MIKQRGTSYQVDVIQDGKRIRRQFKKRKDAVEFERSFRQASKLRRRNRDKQQESSKSAIGAALRLVEGTHR